MFVGLERLEAASASAKVVAKQWTGGAVIFRTAGLFTTSILLMIGPCVCRTGQRPFSENA
jgi:hypothetical protein